MHIKTKKKISIALCLAMLSASQTAMASKDGVYSGREVSKTDHLYVPGSMGSQELWGRGATPEELWNSSADLEYQGFLAAFASIGATIARVAAQAATLIVGVISSAISAAGGIASVLSGIIPQAISLGKDMLMSRLAAGDAVQTQNSENAAAMAQLQVQLIAQKESEERAADAAFKLEQMKADKAKEASIEAAKIAAEATKSGDAVKIAEANKAKAEAEAKAAALTANVIKKAEQKDQKDKQLAGKLEELSKANQVIVAKVDEAKTTGSATAVTSSISPIFFDEKRSSHLTFASDSKKKATPISFQENLLEEQRCKEELERLTPRLSKQYELYNNALAAIINYRTKGLSNKDEKDLTQQEKADLKKLADAVDLENNKYLELKKQADKHTDRLLELFVSRIDPQDLNDVIAVIGDSSNQPKIITKEEMEAELKKIDDKGSEYGEELDKILAETPEVLEGVK